MFLTLNIVEKKIKAAILKNVYLKSNEIKITK